MSLEPGYPPQPRYEVFEAIQREREYQDKKWVHWSVHPHDVPGWLVSEL